MSNGCSTECSTGSAATADTAANSSGLDKPAQNGSSNGAAAPPPASAEVAAGAVVQRARDCGPEYVEEEGRDFQGQVTLAAPGGPAQLRACCAEVLGTRKLLPACGCPARAESVPAVCLQAFTKCKPLLKLAGVNNPSVSGRAPRGAICKSQRRPCSAEGEQGQPKVS